MEGSVWMVLLAAIALVQLIHAGVTIEGPEPGKHLKFYGGVNNVKAKADFPLLDNETEVVYSRNIGPNGIFAYATHDPLKKFAVFVIASAKEDSQFRKRRCEFDFDVPDGSTIVLDNLRVWSDEQAFSIAFAWHIKGNETDIRLNRLDSITCPHAEQFRDLKDVRGKKIRADETAADELARLEIPKGYYVVDKISADESRVRINYANMMNGVVSLNETIENRPHVDGLWVESLELDRYGACWEVDMKLTCGQGPLGAQEGLSELTTWASLPLPRYHDWLGVINYAEGRMLLIMGDSRGVCTPTANCDYFLLYEMRPNGKIYRHQGAHILLGGCSKPAELTVDAYHHENGTCFNIACVGLSNSKRTLKYRQACAVLV